MDKLMMVAATLKMAVMVWALIYLMTLDGFNDELTQILVHVKVDENYFKGGR